MNTCDTCNSLVAWRPSMSLEFLDLLGSVLETEERGGWAPSLPSRLASLLDHLCHHSHKCLACKCGDSPAGTSSLWLLLWSEAPMHHPDLLLEGEEASSGRVVGTGSSQAISTILDSRVLKDELLQGRSKSLCSWYFPVRFYIA